MDSRQVKTPKYMVYCVLVACIGSFSNGWTIGCANLPGDVTHQCPTGMRRLATPVLPDCIPMGTSLWGFAVASFCVGGLVGGVCGGWVQTKLGRKKAIIWNTLGWIIGGLLLGLSVNVAMFIIGRILCGLSCGLGSLAIPTYIGETSSIRARGAMGAMNQFLIVIGILLSAIIGLPTSSVPYWRINFAIVGVPAIIQAMLMTTCVESPRWLVSDSRLEEARASLQRLRGKNAIIQNEFYEIVEGQVGTMRARSVLQHPENAEKILSGKWSMEEINEANNNHNPNTLPTDTLDANEQQKIHPDVPRTSVDNDTMINPVPTGETVPVETGDPSGGVHKPMNIIQIFRDPVIRRISLVVFMHHAIQQLSGMNAVMYYSTNIFASAFDLTMSKYMAIATNGVNFVVTIGAVYLVDRMGRRPLLLIAEGGACLFSVLLVVGYACNKPALLVVSVFMYVASFAIGIGPIPWMITSELTPTYANSSVGAIATGVNWAMNFVVGQVFPVIFAGIEGYSFAIFAGICLLAWLFTFFMLPETKNRSIENIVKGFQTGGTRMLGLARRRSSENTMVEHQPQQQGDA